MDLKAVKALVGILSKNDLSSIEIVEGDKKIKIEKNVSLCLTEQQTSVSNNLQSVKEAVNAPLESGVDFNNITEVKSPMVGVFYAAPSPESRAYVKIGDRIKKGDVLCIVEAMKLMNEICAETEGEIIDICAENEQVVEYGQTLFKIY
ncbi:MAG: acetyl-CoA carboxylase biotin carboxyl carrier protein [Clostridia bacterium]|nr:acetyl-CoA carboxylase biotin carboxyl carrier protein [Clostridia bacterium]